MLFEEKIVIRITSYFRLTDSIYLQSNQLGPIPGPWWMVSQGEHYYSHLQGLFQRHTYSKRQGLDWSGHSVLVNVINPLRVRRYHSDSSKCPIWQLRTEKDLSPQRTIDQMTSLAA